MKKAVKVPVEFESKLSAEEMNNKIDGTISEQEQAELYKQKGRQVFLWKRIGDAAELRFYHSYKSDMCDTVFQGEIKKGLEGCRLEGFIKKPAGVWAIFWVIVGIAAIIAAAFFFAIFMSETSELGLIPIFLVILVPVAFIEANLLRFDKRRLIDINNYLREFTSAENTDVLGEELENERN